MATTTDKLTPAQKRITEKVRNLRGWAQLRLHIHHAFGARDAALKCLTKGDFLSLHDELGCWQHALDLLASQSKIVAEELQAIKDAVEKR